MQVLLYSCFSFTDEFKNNKVFTYKKKNGFSFLTNTISTLHKPTQQCFLLKVWLKPKLSRVLLLKMMASKSLFSTIHWLVSVMTPFLKLTQRPHLQNIGLYVSLWSIPSLAVLRSFVLWTSLMNQKKREQRKGWLRSPKTATSFIIPYRASRGHCVSFRGVTLTQ